MSLREWRPLAGFPLYEISSEGEVRNALTKRVRRLTWDSRRRYLVVSLHAGVKAGFAETPKQTMRFVHQIVCETFHGPRPEGMEVRHRNGNPTDNRASNLLWSTHADNMRDQAEHGTLQQGGKNPNAYFTADQIIAILQDPRSQSVIAAEYGTTQSYISDIKTRKRWSHITAEYTVLGKRGKRTRNT